jgi:uncharacterized protein (TIGR00369 family)
MQLGTPPGFPGYVGLVVLEADADHAVAILNVRPEHLAPNGFIHAGCLVTLADTACGYGCRAALPAGKAGFATIELKSNHMATAGVGARVVATATPVHRGRSTQVWDAVVTVDDPGQKPRTLAAFRCTQMLLDR